MGCIRILIGCISHIRRKAYDQGALCYEWGFS